MLNSYLKIAWRNIYKYRFHNVVNIIGLSVGVAACLIIFLITDFELGFENFQPDKNRIYRAVTDVKNERETMHFPLISYYDTYFIRKHFSGVEKIAYFFNYYFKSKIITKGQPDRTFPTPDKGKEVSDIIIAEPQYFEIFKYQWVAGNSSSALNDPFRVVLSEEKARSYFGSIPFKEMLGREVIYDDSLHLMVSGIVKDYGNNTDFAFKQFISFATVMQSFLSKSPYNLGAADPSKLGWTDCGQAFVQLTKSASPKQFEKQTAFLNRRRNEQMGNRASSDIRTIRLQPLSDIHFNPDYSGDFYSKQTDLSTLYILITIGVFILFIAAVNFINLSTAQSIRRAKEVGIRKLLGASRNSLIIQFLNETFLQVLAAVILAITIVWSVIRQLKDLIPAGIKLDLDDPRLWAFLLLLTFSTTLLAGFYPAKVLSSFLPAESLKGGASKMPLHKQLIRRSLIVIQFTVSLVFIIGAYVMGDQIHYMLNKNLGFKKDAIIIINTQFVHPKKDLYVLAREIRRFNDIEKVSVSQEPPEVYYSRGGLILCTSNGISTEAQYRSGDDQYLPLYNMKLTAGRNLRTSGVNDSVKEYVINETCVRALGFKKSQDAVGQYIKEGYFAKTLFHTFAEGQIVGVVSDFHSQPLNSPINPVCIGSANDIGNGTINIKFSSWTDQSKVLRRVLNQIDLLWNKMYPGENYKYDFYDKFIATFYNREQRSSAIVDLAMIIALVISCMGLFGLITFITEQRTKEIGIRKILGASFMNNALLFYGDFTKLVLLALVLAGPVSWWMMHKWLENFSYRVNINIWVFVAAGVASILITLITISYKVIKICLSNPVKSLRTE